VIPSESAVRVLELPPRQPHIELRAGDGRVLLEYGPHIRPWHLGDDDEMTGAGAWPTT
jgi:hypothetical protein